MDYGDSLNLPGLASTQPVPDQNSFLDFLRRLQVAGEYTTLEGPGMKSDFAGGRVGYALPVGKNDLVFGASGNMVNSQINTPEQSQTIRNRNLTGLDLSYRQGPNTYGLEWGRGDPMASNMQQIGQMAGPAPNMVPQEFIKLLFRKQF